MYYDKKRAVRNKSLTGKGRVPEKTLFISAILGGALGLYYWHVLLKAQNSKN